MKSIVAIVGRANVGKSRLFNRLVGHTSAIVNDLSGVTRDRHYGSADWLRHEFIVVDTGGIDLDPELDIEKYVSSQSMKAIEEADVILMVFDGQEDLTAIDYEIVEKLRKAKSPVVIAINKIDDLRHEDRLGTFHSLGIEPVLPISAEHGRGVDDLLEEVVKHFPAPVEAKPEELATNRIAIIGRPNVGKSTFINRIAGEDRVVVHETAGTTRDSIDVDVEFDNEKYTLVDTAGIKKGYRVSRQLEKYTAIRSLRAMDKSKIVCQLIDGSEGLTRQDLNLAGYTREQGKGLVLFVNKWDLMADTSWEDYLDQLRHDLKELKDIPICRISAQTGLGCTRMFGAIKQVNEMLSKRLSTAELNRVMETALQNHHLPVNRGKQVRVYYSTQTDTHPPTFMLFANRPQGIVFSYRRYLAKQLSEAMGVKGIPIKLIIRKKV